MEWTFEKQRSIDWTDAAEVAAHRFLFITLVDMHPSLAAACEDPAAFAREKAAYQRNAPAAIASLQKRGLLDPHRGEVWCALCRRPGHTMPRCPQRQQADAAGGDGNAQDQQQGGQQQNEDAAAPSHKNNNNNNNNNSRNSGGVFARFRQHARAAQLAESAAAATNATRERDRYGYKGNAGDRGNHTHWVPMMGDRTYTGRLRSIDMTAGHGEIESHDATITFTLTRSIFGLRKPCEGETLTFRAEHAGDKLRAIDVKLARSAFLPSDIQHVLRECEAESRRDPIVLLRHFLVNNSDWPKLLGAVRGSSQPMRQLFAAAIVDVVSYRPNLLPIHTDFMSLVARLLHLRASPSTSPSSTATAAPQPQGGVSAGDDDVLETTGGGVPVAEPVAFVPDIVSHAIPQAGQVANSVVTVEQAVRWIERIILVARFFFVMNLSSFDVPDQCARLLTTAIDEAEAHFNTMHFENPHVMAKKVSIARNMLRAAHADDAGAVVAEDEADDDDDAAAAAARSRRRMFINIEPLPSVDELRNFHATFDAENLPVLSSLIPTATASSRATRNDSAAQQQQQQQQTAAQSVFQNQRDLIAAHRALLRADVTRQTARMINLSLFCNASVPLDAEALKDLQYTRSYSNVRFVGRTCSRFIDSCTAALINFTVDQTSRPRGAGQPHFEQGQLLYLTTSGDDPAKIDDDNVFWLVVQSAANPELVNKNMVMVSPVLGERERRRRNTVNNGGGGCGGADASKNVESLSMTDLVLRRLEDLLARNERDNTAVVRSRMICTDLFLMGYEPVFRSLSSYLIPTSPVALPMLDEFLTPPTTSTTTAGAAGATAAPRPPPGVIPPYYQDGFDHIVRDIRQRNVLDPGQDAAMASLSTRRLICCQGPPGTGKSFIGCRIVEAYVRYKHAVRNGSMLRHVDPLLLPPQGVTTASSSGGGGSSLSADLTPSMGPILVMTYKNHALDEFLMDLRRSGLWGSASAGTTDHYSRNSVVRVGGGSVEPEMAEVNISTLAQQQMSHESNNSHFRVARLNVGVEEIAASIRRFNKCKLTVEEFTSWLTPAQRKRFFRSSTTAPETAESRDRDLEAFLRGDNYVGEAERAVTKHFMQQVSTAAAASADAVAETERTTKDLLFDPDSAAALGRANTTGGGGAGAADAAVAGGGADSGQQAAAGAAVEDDENLEEPTVDDLFQGDNQIDDEDDELSGAAGAAAGGNIKTGASGGGGGAGEDEEDDQSARQTAMQAIRSEMRKAALSRQGKFDTMGIRSIVWSETLARGSDAAAAAQVSAQLEDAKDLESIWSLSPQERHDFVAARLQHAISDLCRQYAEKVADLELAVALHRHLRAQAKLKLLRTADVVGITTTGCAIQQDLLRSIEPQVVVVEEAAEVLEGQLLACLPESVKQVVLIGDHYQLQPSVATMAYERHNHLNVSLFERLVRESMVVPILLTEQRRMRPEICDMVRPFYSSDEQTLDDHASIATRRFVDRLGRTFQTAGVPGLPRTTFFWTHTSEEQAAEVGRSTVNLREIQLTVLLVQHLLDQKLHPKSICVITPYLGQQRSLRFALRAAGVEQGVRCSTVDRFQGDEADVIILSLVRTQRMTDFLRYRNRLIVAASRARFCMVFIGNDGLLRQSPHWQQVLTMLRARGCVGARLPISFVSSATGVEYHHAEVASSATRFPRPPREVEQAANRN